MATVNLHRHFADSDSAANLLVHEPRCHQRHNLALTRGQRLKSCPYLRIELLFTTTLSITLKSPGHRVKYLLVTKRLGQEVDRAGLHGLDRHRNIAVTGNEDDRYLYAFPTEFRLQIKPAHPGQSDIEHEATGDVGKRIFQQ